MEEEVKRLFEQFIKGVIKDYAYIGTVEAVDEQANTCDVKSALNEVLLHDVRYALAQNQTPGIKLIPKKGSTVVVARERNSSNNLYVAMFGEVEGIELNGKDNGGLVKYKELKAELNKEKQRLSILIQAIAAAPVTPADGGAAFKASLVSATSALLPGNFDSPNILNEKIKHG